MHVGPPSTPRNIYSQLLPREISRQTPMSVDRIIAARLKTGRCTRTILSIEQPSGTERSTRLPDGHNLWKLVAVNDQTLAIEHAIRENGVFGYCMKIVNVITKQSLWSVFIPENAEITYSYLTNEYLITSYLSDKTTDSNSARQWPVITYAIRQQDGKIQWRRIDSRIDTSNIEKFEVIGEEIVVLLNNGILEVWSLHNGETITELDTIREYKCFQYLRFSHFENYFVLHSKSWIKIYNMREKNLCYEIELSNSTPDSCYMPTQPAIHIDALSGKLVYVSIPNIEIVDLCSKKSVFKHTLKHNECFFMSSNILLHPPYLFFGSNEGILLALNTETRNLKKITFLPPYLSTPPKIYSLSIKKQMLLVSYSRLFTEPLESTSFIDLTTLNLIANKPGGYFFDDGALAWIERDGIVIENY